MKSFREFIQGYRGREILSVCNEINCSLREVISQMKTAYHSYKEEYFGEKPL